MVPSGFSKPTSICFPSTVWDVTELGGSGVPGEVSFSSDVSSLPVYSLLNHPSIVSQFPSCN